MAARIEERSRAAATGSRPHGKIAGVWCPVLTPVDQDLNPDAARYAGMDVRRNVMIAICISGAMAGLAGAFEVAGVTHRLYQNISPGYGFEVIAVALLANNNPLAAILSGGLFAMLRSGSEVLQITSQVPQVLVLVIQGIVILSVVAFAKFRGVLTSLR